jgi:hypothetical protein
MSLVAGRGLFWWSADRREVILALNDGEFFWWPFSGEVFGRFEGW